MKPEAVVLQKPMDPGQATLANGVKCGDTFRNVLLANYPDYIDFTGRVLDKHVYVDTRAGNGYLLPEHDEVTRIVENRITVRDGLAGRRILGFAINRRDPERAMLLLDEGPDPDNPGAEECMILSVGSPHYEDPDYAERVRPQDTGWESGVQVTAVRTTDILNPTFLAVLKSWRLMP